MEVSNLIKLFDENQEEFLKFDRIPIDRKFSKRSDLQAFMMLDELIPDIRDMVSAAEHDEIYLQTDLEELAKVVEEEDVIDLIRCGVMVDEETDSLKMFV